MRLVGTAAPFISVVTTLLALPALVQAGPVARKHDGFFLRLSAGAGYASTEIDWDLDLDVPGESEIYGLAGDTNIAIGGIVAKNLALHGTLWGWMTSDPDIEIDGEDFGELNGDVTLGALGAGVTYYFMPSNLYLTASLGLGQLEFDFNQFGEADTDWGPVLDLGLGKEWWVSKNWGLGLAGALGYHSIDDGGDIDENWYGFSYAIRFSATFN